MGLQTRRMFLRGSLVTGVGLLVACQSAPPPSAPAGNAAPTSAPPPAAAGQPVAATAPAAAAKPVATTAPATAGQSARYTLWALADTMAIQQYFAEKYKAVDPHVELQITNVPSGTSHRAKIISAATSGQLPDLLDTTMNYGSDFATYSMFENLRPLLPADFAQKVGLSEKVAPWFLSENIPGYQPGETIGVGYAISVFMPVYRKDLFQQVGAKFPDTWDELVESGKKLTKEPERWALAIPTSGDLIDEFHPYLMQAGVKYMSDDLKKAFPTREETYTAFRFYADLVVKHGIAPKTTPDRFATDPVQRLANGEVTMTTLQTLSIDAMKKKVTALQFGKDWDIGVFWKGSARRGGYMNANAFHIKRGLKDPEPALRYFQWLLEPEQQRELYTQFNRVPISTKVWSDLSAKDPSFKTYIDSIDISERQGGFKGWKLAEFPIDRAVERVIFGGEPVERVVDQTAEDMEQALAQA